MRADLTSHTTKTIGVGLVAMALVVATVAQAAKRMSDFERGEFLYHRHCVQCHGLDGNGDGPAVASLIAEVPSLEDALAASDREAQADVVLKGRKSMPGFEESMSAHDARRVLRYIERVRSGDLPEPEEETEEDEQKKPKTSVPTRTISPSVLDKVRQNVDELKPKSDAPPADDVADEAAPPPAP